MWVPGKTDTTSLFVSASATNFSLREFMVKVMFFILREFTLFVYIKNTFKKTLTWIWAVYQQLHYLWKSQVLCLQIGKLYRAKLCSLWIHFHTEREKRGIPKFLLFLHCWFLCTDPPLSHSLFLWTGLAWLGPYWLRGLYRHSWTNIC